MDTVSVFHGVFLWFILSGGSGYIEPLAVAPLDMSCGRDGAVVGLQLDSVVNPSFAMWPDPGMADKHCRVSIGARVLALPPGEYHSCTTEMPRFMGFGQRDPAVPHIDPHCTGFWTRTDSTLPVAPRAPGVVRISPPPP